MAIKNIINKKIEINLPKGAVDYYNEKFDEKLLELKPPKPIKEESYKESSISHSDVQTIDAKDIIDTSIELCEVDGFGKKTAQYFNTNDNKPIGLRDQDFDEISKHIRGLAGKKTFLRTVSENFIHKTAFEWFKEKYNGEISVSEKFCDYLIKKAKDAINKYEVRCPIEYLSIEKQFSLGKVIFNFFTKEEIKEIEKNILKRGKTAQREKY